MIFTRSILWMCLDCSLSNKEEEEEEKKFRTNPSINCIWLTLWGGKDYDQTIIATASRLCL